MGCAVSCDDCGNDGHNVYLVKYTDVVGQRLHLTTPANRNQQL
jgi:hypothetical protein